jgi:peptidoglycan/xylan/chitin deacetylase (PgdA/CDA1 family)
MEDLVEGKATGEKEYVLSFDDATLDHYEVVFPLLQKHGCQGVFFVPTARLNQRGNMTDAQVRELAAAGHAIGLHSHNHQRMDMMPEEKAREEMKISQKILSGLVGRRLEKFAPPGGFFTPRVQEVAVEQGVRLIRTMRWGYNAQPDPLAMQTVPINRYTTKKRFRGILEQRNPRAVYAGKEMLKRLIPMRVYQIIRRTIFKFSKTE